MKTCSYCKTEKPFAAFNKDKNSKTGYSYACKECRSIQGKNYVARNPEAVKATYLRKYGLSLAQYNQKLVEQNNCCAICNIQLVDSKHTCVDHCHKTGATRDILCRKCNTILGQADDSIDVLKSAIKYLQKHKEAA